MTFDSTLKAPNQSMSGFCSSCHGNFHSSATENGNAGRYEYNGTSGAFLRHPSDYVIPDSSEYAAYTVYNTSAPVARPDLATAVAGTVTPGVDMVMCLSCHQAHATPYDGMLRFDYEAIVAGTTTAKDGCLACHTTKGSKL
jgi:predicted CXXCH cytochrome family protein